MRARFIRSFYQAYYLRRIMLSVCIYLNYSAILIADCKLESGAQCSTHTKVEGKSQYAYSSALGK
jgi:hypothetical protein